MLKFLLAGIVATAALAPVAAAPITYTLSGDFAGTLGGQAFNTSAVFTGVGDTNTLFDGGYYKSVTLTSLTAFAGGVTYTVTDPTRFFANPNSISGFSLASGADFLDFSAPTLATYGASTSFPATPVTFNYTSSFNTDFGQVVLSSATNLVFSATGGTVPEPATWALMIGGFAMTGFAARRRRAAVAV